MRKKIDKKKIWKNVKWAFALSFLIIASLILCQFVVSYAMLFILGAEKLQQPVWTTVYSALVYVLCTIIVLVVSRKILKQKDTRESLGLSELPTWLDIGLVPAGFIAYYVIALAVMMLAMLLLPNIDWQQAQEVGYSNLANYADKLLAFVALVLIAPIAEELIFRGWFYAKLRSRFSALWSILVNSLVFAALHLGFDFGALQWNVAINIFCMSVVLCLLREIRGTIWSGMILHILKNGVAYYLLFVGGMAFLGA